MYRLLYQKARVVLKLSPQAFDSPTDNGSPRGDRYFKILDVGLLHERITIPNRIR